MSKTFNNATAVRKLEREEAIKTLKDLFKRADFKAYTLLRHVSNSGMFRRISVIVIDKTTAEPYQIDHLIARLGTYKRDKKEEGLRVYGCGMDMGFDVVYNTSRAVFKDEVKPDDEQKDAGYKVSQGWL